MSKLKSSNSKLSFSMDEEGDDGEVFVVRKDAPGMKQNKKMKQAPSAASLPDLQLSTPAYPSFGSSYSSETLEQLRNSQKFLTKSALSTSDAIEGMELSGDAAEQFVSMTEKLAPTVDGTDSNLLGDCDDFMAFKTGQMQSKTLLKGKVLDRIHMLQKERKEQFDLEQDNDDEWEAEIIRRGVINSGGGGVQMNKPPTSGGTGGIDTIRTTGIAASSSDSNRTNESVVSVGDVVKMMRLAMDKLAVATESKSTRLEQLRIAEERSVQVLAEHKAKLNAEVDKLNIIEVTCTLSYVANYTVFAMN